MALHLINDIDSLYLGSNEVGSIYCGDTQIWPVGLPVGYTFDFDYTGTVQSVTLPKGRYKLQCWGAQGGPVTGTYAVKGSKGGYAEGELTLTSEQTIYVFVGGRADSYTSSDSQTSTTALKGGWNGGGAGVRTSVYDGVRSFPRGGGGATDMALVTSSMDYSNNRTNRTTESLLSRFIVAGGGAGASAYCGGGGYQLLNTFSGTTDYYDNNIELYFQIGGHTVTLDGSSTYDIDSEGGFIQVGGNNGILAEDWDSLTVTGISGEVTIYANFAESGYSYEIRVYKHVLTGDTSTPTGQGGGTSGNGTYPGTQSSGGGGGGTFGFGASQTATNYKYCSGGGGGGWYGGGQGYTDSLSSYINRAGGGSGFVNIAANASYRPSGYTGLQLDSGSTIAGSSSFPSVSGGTETGHSDHGYARITVIR